MPDGLKKITYEKLELSISVLIAFFIPLNQKIIVYLIALLVLLNIFGWIKRGAVKLDKSFWPFIILFFIYVAGLAFTTNFDYGLKDIETRATFMLFPLLYGLAKRDKPIQLGWIIKALVLGLIIKIGICYYFAYECFEILGYIECFEGSRLAYNIHPTYFALYFIIAGTFYLIHSFEKGVSMAWRISAIVVGGLFLFMVYRLFSLGPVIAVSAMIGTLLYAYFHFRNKKRYFLIGLVVFALAGFFAIQKLPFLQTDVNEVKEELSKFFDNKEQYMIDNQDDPHSVNARIIIWVASFDLVKKHPFGVGTGDYKDVVLANYRANDMPVYADKELNSHCQYLQTAIAVGIGSAILLLLVFGYYIWLGFKQKNLYLIALTSLFATACLFESILERQWGILFFMFFLSLVLTRKGKEQELIG